MENMKRVSNGGRQDWGSPPELIEALQRRFGPIELDVCAEPHNAVAARDGNTLEAIILAGDIRTDAVDAATQLSRARNGEYDE
jgi:hypothetical protein